MSVNVGAVRTLKLLRKTFCVLYFPSWDKKASIALENEVCSQSQSQRAAANVIRVVVRGGPDDIDAEDFVFAEMPTLVSLPAMAEYRDGVLIRFDYRALIRSHFTATTTLTQQCEEEHFFQRMGGGANLGNNISDVDDVRALFEDGGNGVGRLFLSGDKSSVGKTTTCLNLIKSLLRMGISAQDIAVRHC